MRAVSRVAVSGATSFLGSATVRTLLERGCEVCGIVRPGSPARALLPVHPRFREITADVGDAETWTREIKHADTFFHFAWGGPGIGGRSDPVVQKRSADDALKAIEAAARLGVSRFFLSGSQAEYGKVQGKITEDTPCAPVLEYGKNKLRVCQTAPRLANDLGMEYVHARFFSVYGPHDHPYTLIPSCIRAFLRGEVMELSECRNTWNFLHVTDAAEAAVQLAECGLPTPSVTVNLAGTDTRVLREFVEEIHRLCGGRGSCAFGARRVSETPVDNWPDISRLQTLIDWTPKVRFADGVAALIREEAENTEKAIGWKT